MGLIKSAIALAVFCAFAAFVTETYYPNLKIIERSTKTLVLNRNFYGIAMFAKSEMKTLEEYIQKGAYYGLVKLEEFGSLALSHLKHLIDDLKSKHNHTSKPVKKNEKTVKDNYKKSRSNKEKLFTVEQLKTFDGKTGGKEIYIAILGQVFNVKKGKEHYGPDGGYSFFAGRDASRAFVTGNFEEEGLVDDITGLSHQDYRGLDDWVKFYHKDYKYVGKLIGRYYTSEGKPTQYKLESDLWLQDAMDQHQKENKLKEEFPPCNSEWSQTEGTTVWCSTRSGGVVRSWVGVPRLLFDSVKGTTRCACVKNQGGASDKGDLDSPLIKEYLSCDPKAERCHVGHQP